MRKYSIYFIGEPASGEFSLCSGEYCTGPLPWDSSSELIADSIKRLGINVGAHSGGPLPNQIDIEAETDDLSADETHSLSGEDEAYFGGALISVVVASEE